MDMRIGVSVYWLAGWRALCLHVALKITLLYEALRHAHVAVRAVGSHPRDRKGDGGPGGNQPAPAAPGVLARIRSQLDWYWTLSPPGRAAFWATFGGWALDAYNQMTLGFILPAVTAAFALSTTQGG